MWGISEYIKNDQTSHTEEIANMCMTEEGQNKIEPLILIQAKNKIRKALEDVQIFGRENIGGKRYALLTLTINSSYHQYLKKEETFI